MLKGRGRDPRGAPTTAAAHLNMRPIAVMNTRPTQAAQVPRLPAKPEPDYEVVEFPAEQYVNAKLQPPPPPPPRPSTGHPPQAGAACGLCGGGGARVRCAECGRRALCASCDDMYHRHPKRRNHQRQALSPSQLTDVRPPLPPKANPPVPPPRRHKTNASPKPPNTPLLNDQRRATLNHVTVPNARPAPATPIMNHNPQHPMQLPAKMIPAAHLGSMPFLPTAVPHPAQQHQFNMQHNANTMGHLNAGWNRSRGSLQGFNMQPMDVGSDVWESGDRADSWGRPLRRGASVLELGGACGACGPAVGGAPAWRYGSVAALDQPWPGAAWPAPCCAPPHHHHPAHHLAHTTPQPYRRADSRAVSRAASRLSRAASPALSVRSRTSRRGKPRSPSPPLPSSDADSESESDRDIRERNVAITRQELQRRSAQRRSSGSERRLSAAERCPTVNTPEQSSEVLQLESEDLGPVPPPPSTAWHCEHCTYLNEPGVRVCVICCRTPTAPPQPVAEITKTVGKLIITSRPSSPARLNSEITRVTLENKQPEVRKERISTGCGPSPPRESQRAPTSLREHNGNHIKHDMSVGSSPPRQMNRTQNLNAERSPQQERHDTARPSPYRENAPVNKVDTSSMLHNVSVGPSPPRHHVSVGSSPPRHNVSVGPSPPRHNVSVGPSPPRHDVSVGPSPPRENAKNSNFQKKSTGTSPPRDVNTNNLSSSTPSVRSNVSTTGTSPPPQTISTQTYDDPSSWERPESRSRARRRFRDNSARERSHSRHSLSSDTRESERSVRTTGGWEWERRAASPAPAARRAPRRRASHLDLRTRHVRNHSQATSPDRWSDGRAVSMETLGVSRDAERGLELARLLAEAERLGYTPAEVQAALMQRPGAPIAWLRERWAGLVGAVQGAAARLAGRAPSSTAARAALARHGGAVWPAVTDCVDSLRDQAESSALSPEGRLRGRVWGSPAGADDEAAPRARAADSSDEYDGPGPFPADDWSPPPERFDEYGVEFAAEGWPLPGAERGRDSRPPPADEIAVKLRALLIQAGIPGIDENLMLKGLLSEPIKSRPKTDTVADVDRVGASTIDLLPSESDFIDAYNALTRASPLPNARKLSRENQFAKDEMTKAEIKDEEQPQINKNQTKIQSPPHIIIDHNNSIEDIPKQTRNDDVSTEATVSNISQNNIQNLESTKLEQISHNISEVKIVNKVSTNSDNLDTESVINLKNKNTQAEEKSNNLNEIVDSTQKLIQQMKEEINSDINSIDGGHTQSSQSDHDSSSNDEQESSYSESDNESERISLTSNEKEITSEDEIDYLEKTPRNAETYNNTTRTSSEENEQFEEALDDLDNQIEDVKHFNIEILDSIARSLQDEHTLTIEVPTHDKPLPLEAPTREKSLPTEASTNEKSLPIEAPSSERLLKVSEPKQVVGNEIKNLIQNNIFVEVNTFEEIYEQLNSTKAKTPQPVVKTPRVIVTSEQVGPTVPVVEMPNVNVTPQPADEAPRVVPPLQQVVVTPQQVVETTHFEIPQPIVENQTIRDLPKVVLIKHEIKEEAFEPVKLLPVTILENQLPKYNAILDNIEVEEQLTSVNNDENITHQESDQTNNTNGDIIQFIDQTTDSKDVDDTNFIPNNAEENHQEPIVEFDTTIEIKTDEKITKEIKIVNIEIKKDDFNPIIDTESNKSPPKSNIPKPIRNLNKAKQDKTTPKVIASKVPVRRSSLKQYPAPSPPKTHFGNVQSGHVKQLQSKIFNSNKPLKSTSSEKVEPKPSTSTLTKKNPAPQPPALQKEKRLVTPSPPKSSPPKETKQYFRETCRTEDEWTESDSEDSQCQPVRRTQDENLPTSPPSPPPPITLRRVSGNVIDLATVSLPEGSPERQARMLLAEGATETWEQAELAVELISRGADVPAALLAALECVDLQAALAYLHQDCELCASRLPEHEMVSMLRCIHRCCRECARLYFTVQITERSIADCVCPFCKMPELENLPEDAWLEYFAHLDIFLKTLLETDVHELFQRKLRDRTLARDPNFRWCMECSSGFFVHPKQKKLRCPECRSISCASCRKPWTANHEGLTCEQYTAWLEDNDPERSVAAVQQHLRENGLECPRCRFKYSLSRGGCMHFTCTQCKYEFCYGCGKPFTMGARCGLSDYCAKLGLHAHHPRNCLFYLRDKEPHELQTLLQMNNVEYETTAAEGSNGRCPIQLQRETPTGLVDGTCGHEAPPNYAGLCKPHYVEYLAGLARSLDPIPIMDVPELVAELRRRGLPLPERGPWDTDPIYAGMCAEIVKEKIPLD